MWFGIRYDVEHWLDYSLAPVWIVEFDNEEHARAWVEEEGEPNLNVAPADRPVRLCYQLLEEYLPIPDGTVKQKAKYIVKNRVRE